MYTHISKNIRFVAYFKNTGKDYNLAYKTQTIINYSRQETPLLFSLLSVKLKRLALAKNH